MDSLLSITIFSKIHEVLQVQLPASTFTDVSTLYDLKDYIFKHLPDQSPRPPTPVSESGESIISSASTRSQNLPSTPPDSRLSEVYSIIADKIGVDMEEILATEDLLSLRLDSMIEISITRALSERIGIEVPSGLFDTSSAKDLHKSLNRLFRFPKLEPQRDIQSRQKKKNQNRSLPASITLQGNGHSTSKALFLFPDRSRLTTTYAKLRRISKDLRIYGLNSPLLYEKNIIPRDIPSITSRMVENVRQIQPRGPYILGG